MDTVSALFKKRSTWTAAKLAGAAVFAMLWAGACNLLFQSGLVRDEFGLSGPGPFYAGSGLWLAMIATFGMAATLGISLLVHIQRPGARRGAMMALGVVGLVVAGYTLYTLYMCADYHSLVSGGIY